MKGDKGAFWDKDFRGVHNRSEVKANKMEKKFNRKEMKRQRLEDAIREVADNDIYTDFCFDSR